MSNEEKKLLQWVISLAVSVGCCAVLFVVFANFLLENQREMVKLQYRIDMIEERSARFENNLMMMNLIRAQAASPQVPATAAVPTETAAPAVMTAPAVAPASEPTAPAAP